MPEGREWDERGEHRGKASQEGGAWREQLSSKENLAYIIWPAGSCLLSAPTGTSESRDGA